MPGVLPLLHKPHPPSLSSTHLPPPTPPQLHNPTPPTGRGDHHYSSAQPSLHLTLSETALLLSTPPSPLTSTCTVVRRSRRASSCFLNSSAFKSTSYTTDGRTDKVDHVWRTFKALGIEAPVTINSKNAGRPCTTVRPCVRAYRGGADRWGSRPSGGHFIQFAFIHIPD